MATIARQGIPRVASGLQGSSRGIQSSAIVFAAKGKPAKGAAPAKKAQQGFAKKGKPGAGGGGGGGSGAKKIQLKYDHGINAPELKDVMEFQPENVREANIGTPVILTAESQNHLSVFGLPRRLDKEYAQGQAVSVVRRATVDLAKRLDSIKAGAKESQALVLTGEQGSGKSTLLLQSAVHALNSGWIVLYIPRAKTTHIVIRQPGSISSPEPASEWTASSSPYAYSSQTQLFSQPALASLLLERLIKVNGDLLNLIKLDNGASTSTGADADVKAEDKGETVLDLAKRGVGVDAGEGSVDVLRQVLRGLGNQSEIPFLLAIDEAQALFDRSQYLTPTGGQVESYHLSTPRLVLDFISGREQMKAGLILSSLSSSTPSLPPTLSLLSALSLPTSVPITPYTPLHPVHSANAAPLAQGVVHVDKMDIKEAGGMFKALSMLGRTGARVTQNQNQTQGGDAGAAGEEAFISALIRGDGNPLKFSRSIQGALHA